MIRISPYVLFIVLAVTMVAAGASQYEATHNSAWLVVDVGGAILAGAVATWRR